MPSPPPVTPSGDHDFLAIEGAVLETARGRWFLSEFANRHRAADTEAILGAIARLEATAAPAQSSELGRQLGDLQRILAKARAASWGGLRDDRRPAHLAALQTAESAMAAIRKTGEKIREVAFELRESARLDVYAEALELYCDDLGNAAALQEAATRQLIELAALLAALETRIAAIQGTAAPTAVTEPRASQPADAGPVSAEAALLPGRPAAPLEPGNAPAAATAPPLQPGDSGPLPTPGQGVANAPKERAGRAMLFVKPGGLPRTPA